MTRARAPRLPHHRVSPGQLAMFDPAFLLRAQRRYPDAVRFAPTTTGRVLSVLSGGTPAPAPVVAIARKAKAA